MKQQFYFLLFGFLVFTQQSLTQALTMSSGNDIRTIVIMPQGSVVNANPACGSATTLGTLPVTFIDFTGTNKGNDILLHWSTAQESNNSHFEIQRNAHNDVLNFTAVDIVNAAGESSSSKDYYYTDRFPLDGINYYRIKQVDKDNRFMYSNIISVRYEPKGMIRSFLNPIQSSLFFELIGFNPNINTVNEWRLYDLHGKIVATDKITSHVIYGQPLSIPAAMYVLEIRLGNKTERVKIIKQ
jgi:hypothetical protein